MMAHKEMKAELTCPICMELFRQPRRLPCGHAYCHRCISTLLQVRAQQLLTSSRRLVCPECRDEMRVDYVLGIEALPLDFKLSRLVELMRSMEATSSNSDNDAESSSPAQDSPESGPLVAASPSVPSSLSTTSPSTPPTRAPLPPLPPLIVTRGLPNSGLYLIGPDGEPFTVSYPPDAIIDIQDMQYDSSDTLAPLPRTDYDDYLDTLTYPELWNEASVALNSLLESVQTNQERLGERENIPLASASSSSSSSLDLLDGQSLSSSSSSLHGGGAGGLLSSTTSSSSDENRPPQPWSARRLRDTDTPPTTVAGDNDGGNDDTSVNRDDPVTSEALRDHYGFVPLSRAWRSRLRDRVELDAEVRNENVESSNEARTEIVESSNEARTEIVESSNEARVETQNDSLRNSRHFRRDNVEMNDEPRHGPENPRQIDLVRLFSEGQRHGGEDENESGNAEAFREFLRFRNRLPQLERSSETNHNDNGQTEHDLPDSTLDATSLGTSEENNEESRKGKDNFKIKYLKLKKRVVNIFKDTYSTTESSDAEIEQERERQREKERKKEEEEREKQRLSTHRQKFTRERRKWRMTRRLMSLIMSDDSSSSEDDLNLNGHRNGSGLGIAAHNGCDKKVEGVPSSGNAFSSSQRLRSQASRKRHKKTPYRSGGVGRDGDESTEDDEDIYRRSTNALIAISLRSSSNDNIHSHSRLSSPPQGAYPVPSIPPLVSTYDNITTNDGNQAHASSRQNTASDSTALELEILSPLEREVSVYQNTHPSAQHFGDRNPNLLSSVPVMVTQQVGNIAEMAEIPTALETSLSSQQDVVVRSRDSSSGVGIARQRLASETEGGATFYDNVCEEEISQAISREDPVVNRISLGRVHQSNGRDYNNAACIAAQPEIEDLKTGFDDGRNDSTVLESRDVESLYREEESVGAWGMHQESNLRTIGARDINIEETLTVKDICDNYEIETLKEKGWENGDSRSVTATEVKQMAIAKPHHQVATHRLDRITHWQQDNARQPLEETNIFRQNGSHRPCAVSLYDNVAESGISREIRNCVKYSDDGSNGRGNEDHLRRRGAREKEDRKQHGNSRNQTTEENLGQSDDCCRDNAVATWPSVGTATTSVVPLSPSSPTENGGNHAVLDFVTAGSNCDRDDDNNNKIRSDKSKSNKDNEDESDLDLESAAPHSAMLKYSSGGDSGVGNNGNGKKPKSRFRKFISSLMWVSSSSSSDEDGGGYNYNDF